jgi:HEAT repeat protein
MKKRRWIITSVVLFALAAVLALPGPGNWRTPVGLVRGENFWRFRPTNYWRAEMQEWLRIQKNGWTQSQIERWLARVYIHFRDPRFELAPIWLMEDDPAAVPLLRELARDEDPDVSAHAVTALRVLREAGRPGLPEFRAALQHPAPITRLIAIEGIWDLTHEADELVPVLVALLDNADQNVQWRVEANLERIGPAAKAAVPGLVNALEKSGWAKNLVTQREVGFVNTLVALGPEGRTAASPYLLALLELGIQRGTKAKATISIGKRLEWSDIYWIQRAQHAAVSLAASGLSTKEVLPLLIQALEVPWLRCFAARALHRIDAKKYDSQILTCLLMVLQCNTDPEERCAAARVLGELGDAARPALPELELVFKDCNSNRRVQRVWNLEYATAQAIWRIDHRPDAVLTAIPLVFHGSDNRMYRIFNRSATVQLLAEMGPSAKDAVPNLIADLTDTSDFSSGGGNAWGLRENLREAKRNDVKYRVLVTQALGAIGPDAKAAVPALIAALQDESPLVRDAAAAALRKIDSTLQFELPPPKTPQAGWTWTICILAAGLLLACLTAILWRWRRRARPAAAALNGVNTTPAS